MLATAIDSKLTATGKDDERALSAGYVYRGEATCANHVFQRTATMAVVAEKIFRRSVVRSGK
jgi:hypothetical protein